MRIPTGRTRYSLATLWDFLKDAPSILNESESMTTAAASADVDITVYKTELTTGATEGVENIAIPNGSFNGQRKWLYLTTRTNASDSVAISTTNINVSALTLDVADEEVLLEWDNSLSMWNVIYATNAGIANEAESVTTDGSPTDVSLLFYKTEITTGATAGEEFLAVPNGTITGQIKWLYLVTRSDGSDTVTVSPTNINADTVTLDAADEEILLRWNGVTDLWDVLYSTAGVASLIETMTTASGSQAVSAVLPKTEFVTDGLDAVNNISITNGTILGQRKWLYLTTRTSGSDTVVLDVTNVNAGSVIFDANDEEVLLEWDSVGSLWGVVSYTPGVVDTAELMTTTSAGQEVSFARDKTVFTTDGQAGVNNISIANGTVTGQRKWLYLGTRTDGSDTVVLDVTNVNAGFVILDAADEEVLLEWDSVTSLWNVLSYTAGVVNEAELLTTASGSLEVSMTRFKTEFTTDGLDAVNNVSVANGTVTGQRKWLYLKTRTSASDTVVVAPGNITATSVIFDADDEEVMLEWDNDGATWIPDHDTSGVVS